MQVLTSLNPEPYKTILSAFIDNRFLPPTFTPLRKTMYVFTNLNADFGFSQR